MASSNLDFADYQKVPPSYGEPPRQRGCLFYGCIIAAVLALLILVAVVVIAFLLYRFVGSVVEEYTATAPRELPRVTMPAEKRADLKKRVDAFRASVKEGRPTEPLVLDSDELNVLIQEDPNLNGKVYVAIEGDKLKGQVSIPLSQIPVFGLTRGRYLNGEAELRASLQEGVLIVTLQSLSVNGKEPPPEMMKGLRSQNLARDAYKDEKTAEEVRKYQSIEIKDGKVIIKARQKDDDRPGSGEAAEGTSRVEARNGKAIVHPPQEKPAPKGESGSFPEDVLAPAGSRPAAPANSARKP